jgi:2-polyprenyl-6-methoxyphenol hydroxylase-like FAD-dependent oxidoreductase
MAQVDRILIVGGGITGVALGVALSRQGLAAEIVERSATAQASAPFSRWGFYDQRGERLCRDGP